MGKWGFLFLTKLIFLVWRYRLYCEENGVHGSVIPGCVFSGDVVPV